MDPQQTKAEVYVSLVRNLAATHFLLQNINEFLTYLGQSEVELRKLSDLSEHKPRKEMDFHYLRAYYYLYTGQYPACKNEARAGEKIARKQGDDLYLAQFLNLIGEAHNQAEPPDKETAYDYFIQVSQLAEKNNNRTLLRDKDLSFAEYALDKGDLDQADTKLDILDDFVNKKADIFFVCWYNILRGRVYLSRGTKQTIEYAIEELKKNMTYAGNGIDPQQAADTVKYYLKAHYDLYQLQPFSSLKEFDRSFESILEVVKKFEIDSYEANNYLKLYEQALEMASGNQIDILKYFQQVLAVLKSIEMEDDTRHVHLLPFINQIKKHIELNKTNEEFSSAYFDLFLDQLNTQIQTVSSSMKHDLSELMVYIYEQATEHFSKNRDVETAVKYYLQRKDRLEDYNFLVHVDIYKSALDHTVGKREKLLQYVNQAFGVLSSANLESDVLNSTLRELIDPIAKQLETDQKAGLFSEVYFDQFLLSLDNSLKHFFSHSVVVGLLTDIYTQAVTYFCQQGSSNIAKSYYERCNIYLRTLSDHDSKDDYKEKLNAALVCE